MARATSDRQKHPLNTAFTRYRLDLHRFLLRRLQGAQEAEDLAQEVYLRLLRVENSELIRSPLDYLYGIATHVVYQFRIRKDRDVVTFDSEAAAAAADAMGYLEADELHETLGIRQQIERALERLPAQQRAAFLLRKRDGLSVKEIARELGLSVHTVKKYIFRAQAHVRISWEQGMSDHD